MSIILKAISIPLLVVLALLGGGAAYLVVWFLLPELRPTMRRCARNLASVLRPRPAGHG